jgi:hypothetical protein
MGPEILFQYSRGLTAGPCSETMNTVHNLLSYLYKIASIKVHLRQFSSMGSEYVTPLIPDFGTRYRIVVSFMRRPSYHRR